MALLQWHLSLEAREDSRTRIDEQGTSHIGEQLENLRVMRKLGILKNMSLVAIPLLPFTRALDV